MLAASALVEQTIDSKSPPIRPYRPHPLAFRRRNIPASIHEERETQKRLMAKERERHDIT
jgi:hypothetical protein